MKKSNLLTSFFISLLFSVQVFAQPLAASISSSVNVSCNGACDGQATASGSFGTAPYSYQWDAGAGNQTDATATGLCAGAYTVTVTDNAASSDLANVTITEPTALSITITATDASCNGGNDGSATVTATGGLTPYTYAWSNSTTSATAANLTAGTYTVTVTDANNCTATASGTVTEPTAINVTISSTNVSCNGGSDGTATVSGTGGLTPYVFNWSIGQSDTATSSTAGGLVAGVYNVTATDAAGCSVTINATVTEPAAIAASAGPDQTICESANAALSGSVTVATGGNWTTIGDGSFTDVTALSTTYMPGTTDIAVGTATLTLTTTGNGSCAAASNTMTLTILPSPTITISSTDVSCNGNCDGTATASITNGGNTPYTYNWSNGAVTSSITNICPGTYGFTFTNANGCSAISSATVTEPPVLTVSVSATDETCPGCNDGSASATVSGGTTPYDYNWSNGSPDQNIGLLPPGTYTVTVTDTSGCVVAGNIDIFAAPQVNFSHDYTQSCTPVTVNFTNTSSGNISSYQWHITSPNDLDTTITADSITFTFEDGGSFDVQLCGYDALNNQIGCYNQNINVDGPPGNFPMPDSACPGDVIYLDAGFNTNDNSIEWDFGDGTTAGGYDVTHAYSTAGTYTITLIAQDQQCGIYDTIAQNIVITNNAPAYSFFSAWETPACPNDQITFDAQGVAGSIYWQFGDGNDTTVTQGRTYHSYSSIGTYTASLIVTNGCGNSDTSTQIINVYDTLSANVSNIDPQPDTACIGDALEFKYNGTLPSFFVWNYGDGNLDTNNTSPSHIYAANGTYTATVTVTNGCGNSASSSTTVLITTNVVPNPQDFDFGPIPQVACPGDSIIFYTNGGGVSYLWDFGDGNTGSPNTTFDNSPVVLYAYADTGTYNTTFTLTNGCGNSASVGVPVYIVDTASLIPPSWTGGQGFSFEGENGDGTQTVSVCQEIGFVSLVSGNYFIWNFGDGTVDTINGSLANTHVYTATGTYTISLFVQNSCGDTATFTTQITVSGTCLGPVASITSTNPSCNSNSDGIASASAVGGTSPYSYNWSTTATTANISGLAAGVYTVTVTDSLGLTGTASITLADPAVLSATTTTTNAACGSSDGTATATASGGTSPYSYAWSDGSTAATASNLAFGTYSVTATDVNGCTATATASVVNSSAPAVSISGTDESSCGTNDGFALVTVSGGASPYTYQWSNGATTKNITNVTAGNYSLTVTDANGCISTGSVTINAPTPPATSIATSDATACGTNDGVAALTITGGTTPYSYSWSNGSSNQNLTLVGGGTYVVIVTDANSCTAVDTAVIGAPGTATITITGTDISCYDANNGAADLTVTGGNLPYIYNWSNGETTEDLSGLGAGIYEVTVTDANGCIVNGDATINQPAAITISSTVTDVVTCGDTTGAIAIAVSGGSGTFSYSWSNGANSGSLQNLSAGTYSVTVTDASGCTQTENIVVSAPSTATLSFTSNDATCNESCDGNATVSASGGTSPFTYLWETSGSLVGQTDAMASGLCAGTYNVIVTEANGCVANDSVAISEPSALSLTISATDATCGITDGNATVSASGGTAPYDYQWTTGDSTTTADSIGSGIYIVTVTDANSCVEFALATINDVGGPSVTVNSTSDVTCNGNSTGAISLSVTAGTTPYTYSWSNGSTTEDIFNLIAGPYEVNVTDAGGCVAVQSISISEPDAISLSVSATDANCGSADGSATVSVTGGVSPYTYVWSSGATANSNSGLTSGTYIVTVTDANGCMAVTTAAISEVGGATIAIDSIVDAGCGGNGGSIYISTSGGVAPFSYTWSDGTGTEDLINAPAGIYDLTVIGANGCEATATAEISPAIPLTDPICLVSVDTATGGNLIAWQKDTTSGIAAYNVYKETSQSGVYFLAGTVPISSLSVFVDPNSNPLIQSYRYKLALVDSCGEESQLSTEHKTMHLTLSIGLIPGSINLIWDHYEGFSFNSYTIFRYTNVTGWDSIAALPSTNTSYTDFPPSGITSDLRYFVEAKHPNGCTATKASENYNSSRSNISQQLGSSPLLAAIISTDATFGNCDGTATVTPSGGEPPYTYQWDDANNQTDSTAVTLCPGIYNVTVTDFNGNTTTANVTVGEEVGVDEFTVHSSLFTVYPNPNEGVFTLKMENGKRKIENVELRVLNLLGEVVHQPSTQDISGQANHQSSIEIDLSGQPSGIYYLQIITNGGIAVKKVVIE